MTSSATVSPNQDAHPSTKHEPSLTNDSDNKGHSNKANSQSCLKLKGSLIPMTVLELTHYDAEKIRHELHAKTTQAPGFFENLPVVIDIDKLDEHEHLPFSDLIELCLSFSIKIVAVRGGHETHQATAKHAGLGLLAKQKDRPIEAKEEIKTETREVAQAEKETIEVIKTVIQSERQQSKIIHHPIRSGQQVYAADGDLIVMASVSAGAEILADGNIHVYGALRGRALAGVKGDTSARIFCQSLEAELVSVAGQYKISEDIEPSAIKQASQVYLDDNSLSFKKLEI